MKETIKERKNERAKNLLLGSDNHKQSEYRQPRLKFPNKQQFLTSHHNCTPLWFIVGSPVV